MEPVRRIAHKNASVASLLRPKRMTLNNLPTPKSQSVSTPVELINLKSRDNEAQSKQFITSRTTFKSESTGLELDKLNMWKNACKAQNVAQKRRVCGTQMDTSKDTKFKRLKKSVDLDRYRLKKLMQEINSDPPPSWHKASLMWLDVDVLERRIEEFEKDQTKNKEPV